MFLLVGDRSLNQACDRHRRGAQRHHEQPDRDEVYDLREFASHLVQVPGRAHIPPDRAILRRTKAGRYNLLVMGVTRRADDKLFFGDTAQKVLEQTECSIMFITGEAPKRREETIEREKPASA